MCRDRRRRRRRRESFPRNDKKKKQPPKRSLHFGISLRSARILDERALRVVICHYEEFSDAAGWRERERARGREIKEERDRGRERERKGERDAERVASRPAREEYCGLSTRVLARRLRLSPATPPTVPAGRLAGDAVLYVTSVRRWDQQCLSRFRSRSALRLVVLFVRVRGVT